MRTAIRIPVVFDRRLDGGTVVLAIDDEGQRQSLLICTVRRRSLVTCFQAGRPFTLTGFGTRTFTRTPDLPLRQLTSTEFSSLDPIFTDRLLSTRDGGWSGSRGDFCLPFEGRAFLRFFLCFRLLDRRLDRRSASSHCVYWPRAVLKLCDDQTVDLVARIRNTSG